MNAYRAKLLALADEFDLGGKGSGNYGHAGRPGQVGGSGDSGDATGSAIDTTVAPEGRDPNPAPADNSVQVPIVGELGDKRPTPIQAKDLADAVDLILKGEVVELPDVGSVHTVLSKLADMAKDAEAKDEKAPDYDLCNVSVAGTNLFCGSFVRTEEFPNGIPRLDMPQLMGKPRSGSDADNLPKNHRGNVDAVSAFLGHLEGKGIEVSPVEAVPAASLKASQVQLVGPQVAAMMLNSEFEPGDEPIIVSSDNYVLDGHHRWAAVVGRDSKDGVLGQSTMNVVRVDAPISELLHRANLWTKEFGILPKQGTKKGKTALAMIFGGDLVLLGGSGSGNYGHSGRKGEIGGSGKGQATDSPAFKKWFKDSAVVDENGDPLRVYHGTTHDISAFREVTAESVNPESDWGAGTYFTSDPEDASENYAGVGPDLTSRIEERADRLESGADIPSDIDPEDFTPPTHDEAVAQATEELVGAAKGLVIPAYLSMQKPFVIGAANGSSPSAETHFEKEYEYENPNDPDSDIVGEKGSLPDFLSALRDEASLYRDGTQAVDRFTEKVADDDYISGSKLQRLWKETEESGYIEDDQGRLVRSEVFRGALQRAGFDGVVDRTVHSKFSKMKGVNPDTTHFITFQPTQVKSAIGNQGTFNPASAAIAASVRFRPTHLADREYARDEAGRFASKLAGLTLNPRKDVAAAFDFESQVGQFPKKGPPGIKAKRVTIKGDTHVLANGKTSKDLDKHIDVLTHRDEHGALTGVAYHYPQNIPPYEKKGNVNILVSTKAQRQGIGTRLLKEAEARWDINFPQQTYTTAGRKLIEGIRKKSTNLGGPVSDAVTALTALTSVLRHLDFADRDYVRDEGGRFAETGGSGTAPYRVPVSRASDYEKAYDAGEVHSDPSAAEVAAILQSGQPMTLFRSTSGRPHEPKPGSAYTLQGAVSSLYLENPGVSDEHQRVNEVVLDPTGLTIEHLDEPYDADSANAPGDSAEERADLVKRGVDVVVYHDAVDYGDAQRTERLEHTTVRVVSDRAAEQVNLVKAHRGTAFDNDNLPPVKQRKDYLDSDDRRWRKDPEWRAAWAVAEEAFRSGQRAGKSNAEAARDSAAEMQKADDILSELKRRDPPRQSRRTDLIGNEHSGNYGHSGRKGQVGGSGKSSQVPKQPGTTPIPPDTIRAYHYTNAGEEAFANILENGLSVGHARGSTYGEPNVIWFSTAKPGDFKRYVEVHLKPEELEGGVGGISWTLKGKDGSWKRPETAEERQQVIDHFNESGSNFAVGVDKVPASRIVTHSEPWMAKYHQIVHPANADLAPLYAEKIAQIVSGKLDPMMRDPDWAKVFTAIKTEYGGEKGEKKALGFSPYRERLRLFQLGEREYVRDEGGRFAETGGGGHLAKLVDQIKQPGGGFTVNTISGDRPTSGYAVSIYKGQETKIPAKDLTLAHLAQFAETHADLLAQAGNHFGAWHNPDDGNVYLDISKVTPDRAEAERLGQEHDQIAFFDLGAGEAIDTPKKVVDSGNR